MSSTYIGERGPFRKTNRSAFLNFLQAKYEMYTGAVDVRSYPYYFTIDPSDACQLRCPTCPTGIESELRRARSAEPVVFRRKRSLLTAERFDAVLRELGEYLFLLLFYNYGEPLLNRQLPDLIRRAKAYDIEIDVNTNLSLRLSDDYVEDLLASGLDYLFCSIDGFSQDTYEQHRVGGNLALVKENLIRLARTRDRLGLDTSITYNFLVFAFNEHEIPEAEAYCRGLGINFNTREAIIHRADWLPSYRRQETPIAVDDPRWSTFRLPDGFSCAGDGDRRLVWLPFPDAADPSLPSACSWHYGYTAMSAGGAVAPCCAVPSDADDFGQFEAGRVGFADVWNGERYQASRAAFAGRSDRGGRPTETVCTRCPLPKFMHHMYSLHDFKVLRGSHGLFDRADPLLAEGFEVFGRARFGPLADTLYRMDLPGRELERQFARGGSERGMEPFVRFCEEHLAAAFDCPRSA